MEKDDEFDDLEDDDIPILQAPSQDFKEAIKQVLDTFSDEQMQRYEAYRRAGLPKATVKKQLQSILGSAIQPSTAIVVAGAGKVFVGEITEKALDIMEKRGESGPICPHHLRQAYREYLEQGGRDTQQKRQLFK